ncbi:hypothetical protein NFI96_005492 [Prochilodus magdalenae]|nr:hypothetical protein NFI96_005492 [Prochilodus magdalenae]
MSLGQLAEMGTLQQKVLFDETEVAGIKVPLMPMFLCKTPFRKRLHASPTFMVGFIHLSFQEFFTALYYVLLDEDESLRKIRELLQVTDHEKCGEAMGVSPVHEYHYTPYSE